MTEYLMDIASYQRGVDLAKVRAAGFTIANVKTSQGNWYTFGDARTYVNRAVANGMRVSLFHWLDNSASGSAQADYCWRTAGPCVADVGAVAFQVDNEDTSRPATWAITRDFVQAIADRLGHLPYMYTGDWWAQAGGRSAWNVASLTPWLMAAPNAGYLGSYPGDGSSHWRAGYWGYTDLSLMQYAVSGIDGAGGGNISKTAIRDPHLWAALTGGASPAGATFGGGVSVLCKRGDKGPIVVALQALLIGMGYGAIVGDADGDYGGKTSAGLKAALNDPNNNGESYGPWEYAAIALGRGRPAPQGVPGPQGPPGPKGDKGDPGDAAVLPSGAVLKIQ